jgi:cytoskeleton protein RodZ
MPREQAARWPMYTLAGCLAIVLLLAVYEFGFNDAPQDAAKGAPSEGGAASASAAAPAAAAPSAPGAAPAAAAPTESVAAAPKAAPAAAAYGAPPAAGPQPARLPGDLVATAPGAEVAKATPSGQRALHFQFEQDSWVEIRDRNDKVIFSKLNKAGAEERVTGSPPLKLVVGNARGVRLDLDDQPVDLAPHIGVTVARLTLQ